MLKYIPDKFATHYNSNKVWKELWKFLNEKESIIRMQTASDLNRPALEGINELLESQFGEYYPRSNSNKGKFVKLKQMTGHMIRQIMEHNNYIWFKYNIRVKNYYDEQQSSIFVRASLYRRRDRIYD